MRLNIYQSLTDGKKIAIKWETDEEWKNRKKAAELQNARHFKLLDIFFVKQTTITPSSYWHDIKISFFFCRSFCHFAELSFQDENVTLNGIYNQAQQIVIVNEQECDLFHSRKKNPFQGWVMRCVVVVVVVTFSNKIRFGNTNNARIERKRRKSRRALALSVYDKWFWKRKTRNASEANCQQRIIWIISHRPLGRN